MILNIRGTSGSGKSTLVRVVMDKYSVRTPAMAPNRKQPYGYLCEREDGPPLWVPGHYENPCGGCDTISSQDDIQGQIENAATQGYDVIFEGLLVSGTIGRWAGVAKRFPPAIIIALSTPLSVCLDSVQARRTARGDDRPLNPENTTGRWHRVLAQEKSFKSEGVDFRVLSREEALKTALEALKWI